MMPVHFGKPFAKHLLDAVQTGQPIQPPKGGWTGNNMLTLAGMLYAVIFSQGPPAHQAAGLGEARFKQLHPEHREATEENFNADIHNAIDFLSMLTFKVIEGEYDEHFEDTLKAVTYFKDGNGKKPCVYPVTGFKDYKDKM